MKFINKENVKQEPNGLIHDLSGFIIQYLDKLEYVVCLDNAEFTLEQCFSNKCFLPLFLFDLSENLQTFVEELTYSISNNQNDIPHTKYANIIYFECDGTFTGSKVHIDHNLSQDEAYECVVYLGYCILSQRTLYIEDKMISLNYLYDKVLEQIIHSFILNKTISENKKEEGKFNLSNKNS